MTNDTLSLADELREALAVIAYEQPDEPWRVAHDALKSTAQPLDRKALMMADMTQSSTPDKIEGPERIYLQPSCCVDPYEGRQWCEDDVWEHYCEEPAAAVEYVRADTKRSQADEVERLLAQVVAEMPDEVPALLHAFDGPMTSGDVAAAAGLKSGAFAVQFLKQYSLFELSPTRIPHQYLWQLSPLGQQLRAALKGDNHGKG